jgi:hypothetical protein
VLHELVSRYAQTMLAELRDADGRGLPRHIDRELAEYLRCGILAHGFARVRWVGGLIVRAVGVWQRRVARARGVGAPLTGAITFVQRFGGLVNLNVHFHVLVADGVFTEAGDGLAFALLPAPTGVDLLAILDRVIRQISRRLAREAAGANDTDDADLPPDLFAQVQAEAATTWRSPATATANPVRGSDRLRTWCAGFSLHAGVVVPEHDREALERLCRYGARPAFAHDRLTWTADGRISYQLKRPWPDGRTHLVLEPVAFLRRLVGIIPPPRRHLVRYAGIFGPASKARAKLRALMPATDDDTAHAACPGTPHAVAPRARRLPWADLLRRVFAEDVLVCPCGSRRSVVAFVADAGQ